MCSILFLQLFCMIAMCFPFCFSRWAYWFIAGQNLMAHSAACESSDLRYESA